DIIGHRPLDDALGDFNILYRLLGILLLTAGSGIKSKCQSQKSQDSNATVHCQKILNNQIIAKERMRGADIGKSGEVGAHLNCVNSPNLTFLVFWVSIITLTISHPYRWKSGRQFLLPATTMLASARSRINRSLPSSGARTLANRR